MPFEATMRHSADTRTAILQEHSSQTVLQSHVEPTEDIATERQRATFNPEELKVYMNGGRENYEKKIKFSQLMAQSSWGDKSQQYFVSREEEYVHGLKAAVGLWEFIREHELSLKDGAMLRKVLQTPGGLELHIGMFIPTLIGLASPEQQSKWLPLAQSLGIIGTYAQTELGHGTFLRGLQTTATYDVETEEFIIHTPTQTATKWWPGGLGKTATHVVLMARLFVDGTDHGPHGFIVQIRSLDTHLPLPGIIVGDIGPKFGYNAVDNGFLSFDHARIPREDMLSRFAKVTSSGEYIKPPPTNTKASYATMVYVRSTLVDDAARAIGKAVTIAVRYCAVRRQCAAQTGMLETQLIDYQNVGGTLIPCAATAYALHFTSIRTMQMYRAFEKSREHGDFKILPELHALSSALKAVCSWEAVESIEKCRFCCGGHGYSRLSGLPDIYASYAQNPTWEGDNDVLCLQTGRHLLKAMMTARAGNRIEGSTEYLSSFLGGIIHQRCQVQSVSDWLSTDVCLHAFQFRAFYRCQQAEESIRMASGGKLSFGGPHWNNNTVAVIKCAAAHGWCSVLMWFLSTVKQIHHTMALSPPTLAVLNQCLILFALTQIEKNAVDLLEAQYLTAPQLKLLRLQKNALVHDLRPNAVALVDGLGYLDYELNSAIGRSDGDVYKGLLEMARASPMNATEEGPAWKPVLETYMRPKAKL